MTNTGYSHDTWSGPVEQKGCGNRPSLFQQRQALGGYAGKVLKQICSMEWRCIRYPRGGINCTTNPACTANKMYTT
jgi:hypothetical protein